MPESSTLRFARGSIHESTIHDAREESGIYTSTSYGVDFEALDSQSSRNEHA
ncbi:hypothetical protein FOMPIDRAFT_1050712 [Fomitopsis schrenkii]|uniref:Uncharacterized protein n=1 Tax=Fomitopsis schrenkii TaxID=2126942 RepID=S8E7V4_FOMSC|nr:hypothetical protein FOMPIDRAFT_1050712 [Fomitopsis schrenkii]